MGRSSVVLDALSDGNSKLAKFLFVGQDIDDDNNIPRRIGEWEAQWYSLALVPTSVRNERVIMLFEAYAIFGALFMNAVWIMYEWGTWKDSDGDGEDDNDVLGRIFETIMALALCCNLILALFGAWYWIFSISMALPSHEDFVIESIKPIMFLYYLMSFTGTLVLIGFVIGIYLNLSSHLPETIVIIIIAFVISFGASNMSCDHMLACAPLEYYHMPQKVWRQKLWFKGPAPNFWLNRTRMKQLTDRAKTRAQRLKNFVYHDRKRVDPSFSEQTVSSNNNASLVGNLLLAAAKRLNRSDSSVAIYQDRLEKEWLSKPEQLEGMSVECLSRYMPLGLATEVHKLVEESH